MRKNKNSEDKTTDNKKIDIAAAKILERHKAAFIELAKSSSDNDEPSSSASSNRVVIIKQQTET